MGIGLRAEKEKAGRIPFFRHRFSRTFPPAPVRFCFPFSDLPCGVLFPMTKPGKEIYYSDK
jgi:hypothetical protein